MTRQLQYSLLPGRFAVCRLDPAGPSAEWATRGSGFGSVARTADELSVVCPEEHVPDGVKAERGWLCVKLEGPFPFDQTGILASFLLPLAEHKVPIFALSTFDTDYVLIKAEAWSAASAALDAAGHQPLKDR